MRFFRSILACTLSAGLAFGPAAASAQEKKDAQLEEARLHAQKAKVHYDLGEYPQAAEEYTAVYRIKPIPQLLFNIAQSWRQASQYDKAKQFYRAYLREAGAEVKNRAAVEKAIKEIDELLAKEKKTRDAAPTGVARQPIPTPPPALPEQKAAEPAKVAAQKAEEPPKVALSRPAEQPPAVKPAQEKPAQDKPKPAAEKAAVVAVATPPSVKQAPAAAVARPASQATVEEGSPIYKKWWFWTAVGVVAVGGLAAAAGGGNTAPASHFGTAKVF